MRIINRVQFLAMPPGTVYQKYQRSYTDDDLQVKGDNCGTNDWCAAALTGTGVIESSGSRDHIEKLDAMEAGASMPSDFDYGGRDGLFGLDDALFLIYETADVRGLIAALRAAIKETPC